MVKLLPALVLLAVAGLPAAASASDYVFRYRAGTGVDGGQAGESQPGGPTTPGAGTSDGGQPGGSTGNEPTSPLPDRTPAAIDFGSWLNQRPGVETLSSVRRLTDHDGIELAVSGGSDAYLRVCADASCGSPATGWVTTATATRDAYVQLRQVSADFGQSATASLAYGTLTATWTVESAPFATCPGDSMRMRVSTGFEAIVCGLTSAPPNVRADIRPDGTTLVSNSTDGCYYQTNSVMYHNAWVGTLSVIGNSGTSQWQQTAAGVPCSATTAEEFWTKATGMPYPTRFVLVSPGTRPTSNMYSQAITWSK